MKQLPWRIGNCRCKITSYRDPTVTVSQTLIPLRNIGLTHREQRNPQAAALAGSVAPRNAMRLLPAYPPQPEGSA
jgi:hypothetical protein